MYDNICLEILINFSLIISNIKKEVFQTFQTILESKFLETKTNWWGKQAKKRKGKFKIISIFLIF